MRKAFYENNEFAQLDRSLLKLYRKRSAYQISKEFHVRRGAEDPHVYGETPLTTMQKIASLCEIKKGDRVIEMGSGRGRAALFLASFWECEVIAYEEIPLLAHQTPSHRSLKVHCGDMLAASFKEASAIYVYGTLLTENQIEILCNKFPVKTKVITVSYPLSDYHRNYRIVKSFTGTFPWGKTEVYWNERVA